MKKVAIIGGGVSGLIASWVFHQCGAQVRLFEPGKKGAGFFSGGLKYFVRTDEMVRLVNDLGLAFSVQVVRGGILLHGQVEQFPACFRTMEESRAQRIRDDHYRKTRGLEPGIHAVKSMNDPFSTARKALSCDLAEFVRRLADYRVSSHVNEMVYGVDHVAKALLLKSGARFTYDYLVVTTPLWVTRKIAKFPLPEAMAVKLNVVDLDTMGKDTFARWDYVYTPYTPENLVHRVSPSEGGYSVEFNGDWGADTPLRLQGDLNFLFGNAWALNNVAKGLPGHLLPLGEAPTWPADVQPLGRFAAWDSRMTTDRTLSAAIELARKWGFTYEDD